MNVTLPEKEKVSKKTITIYIISFLICILAIGIVIGIQILGNDVVDNAFGINNLIKRTEQEEAQLKANFEEIFNNVAEIRGNYNIPKIDNRQEIVYTNYRKEQKENNYEINVNLPYINIKNKEVEKFNNEILETFGDRKSVV